MTSINMTGTPTSCLTCRVCGCGGLQYDYYRNAWYCPVFNEKTVTDNKTTMLKDVHASNATISVEQTEGDSIT